MTSLFPTRQTASSDARAQRARDLEVLHALLGEDDCPEAFVSMAERLEARGGTLTLTPKQRRWVNQIARSLGVDPSDGEEDDELAEPEPVRFTSGATPRGAEVEILCGPRPLRPPGARP